MEERPSSSSGDMSQPASLQKCLTAESRVTFDLTDLRERRATKVVDMLAGLGQLAHGSVGSSSGGTPDELDTHADGKLMRVADAFAPTSAHIPLSDVPLLRQKIELAKRPREFGELLCYVCFLVVFIALVFAEAQVSAAWEMRESLSLRLRSNYGQADTTFEDVRDVESFWAWWDAIDPPFYHDTASDGPLIDLTEGNYLVGAARVRVKRMAQDSCTNVPAFLRGAPPLGAACVGPWEDSMEATDPFGSVPECAAYVPPTTTDPAATPSTCLTSPPPPSSPPSPPSSTPTSPPSPTPTSPPTPTPTSPPSPATSPSTSPAPPDPASPPPTAPGGSQPPQPQPPPPLPSYCAQFPGGRFVWRNERQLGMSYARGRRGRYGNQQGFQHCKQCSAGYSVELPRERADAEAVVRALRSETSGLLDDSARVLFLNVPFYNPNHDFFGLIRLMVEFTEAGHVWTRENFYFIDLKRYGDKLSSKPTESAGRIFVLVTFVLFVAYYLARMLRALYVDYWGYLTQLWNWVELVNLSIFVAVIAIRCSFMLNPLRQCLDGRVLLDSYDDAQFCSKCACNKAGCTAWAPDYVNMELLGWLYEVELSLLAVNMILSSIAMSKYLRMSSRIYLPWSTMGRAMPNLLTFMIVFLGIMLSFVTVGHFVFGKKVDSFRTFGVSMESCMLFLLGEQEYAAALPAINSFISPIFFYGYVIVMVIVLTNMVVAVLIGAYDREKAFLLLIDNAVAGRQTTFSGWVKARFKGTFGQVGFIMRATKAVGRWLAAAAAFLDPRPAKDENGKVAKGNAFSRVVRLRRLVTKLTSGSSEDDVDDGVDGAAAKGAGASALSGPSAPEEEGNPSQ